MTEMQNPLNSRQGDATTTVEAPLFRVSELKRYFDVSAPFINRLIERQPKQILKAVDGVSFQIKRGETFSLVGESGCGKSTIAKLAVGLYAPTSGSIEYGGVSIGGLKRKQIRDLRSHLQIIFQDPYSSLNPRWRVKDIIGEPIRVFDLKKGKDTIKKRVVELLEHVKLTAEDGDKYPHQFSGGQRQRISIARALASEPEFLVCDEPTSALDVSVQAQILNLMLDLQQEFNLTYLFISHDLAVVHHISDRVGIMYLGRLVEVAPVKTLFRNPLHPYTKMLLKAIPDLEMTGKPKTSIGGEVPNPITPPSGCTFHPRCPIATKHCKTEIPILKPMGDDTFVACFEVVK